MKNLDDIFRLLGDVHSFLEREGYCPFCHSETRLVRHRHECSAYFLFEEEYREEDKRLYGDDDED